MKKLINLWLALLPLCLWGQTILRIEGGFLSITDDVDIVLNNAKWVNNATVNASNGTVHFTGDAAEANTAIDGTSSTDFYKLTINKTSNNVLLNTDATVQNQLALQGGKLDLQTNDLTLGNSSILTQTATTNFIKTSDSGVVKRQIPNGLAITFPIGFGTTPNKLIIQNDGTTDVYSVRVSEEVLEDGNSGAAYTSEVVNRTWWIDENVAGGSDLTITTSWQTANEQTNFDRTNCFLSHYENGNWDEAAHGAATGNNPWEISRSGITTLSPFAVFSGNVLPVELLDFRAELKNKNVALTWETTNEINNAHFEIEHSIDGQNFQKIGRVAAEAFPENINFYEFLHTTPAFGLNYYRLQQVDLDGTFSYSPVRVVRLDNRAEAVFVYPNPTSHLLYFNQAISGEYQLLNGIGQVLQKGHLQTASLLDVVDLPNGNYYLQIINNQQDMLIFSFQKLTD